MEALLANHQTGAWQLLEEGVQGRELMKVPENVEKLLTLPIKIWGTIVPMNVLFPGFSKNDALEIVQNEKANVEITSIITSKTAALDMDENLPKQHATYIQRSISNRLLIDPMVFTVNCEDVFVFKGVERTNLVQLAEPHVTRSSTNQRSEITCRHVYLDDDEDWDDLMIVSKAPIHLICKEGTDYVLHMSSKVTDILFKHALTKSKSVEAYVSEDIFVSNFITSSESNGALICDVPGMGKTWLVESLARKLQIKCKNISFFVKLSTLSQLLGDLSVTSRKNNALELVLGHVCSSYLFALIILQQRKMGRSTPSITFCLDGFDEIRKELVDKTSMLIKELNKYSMVRLLISSRPQMRQNLENTFNVISYDLLPFTRAQQNSAITGYWQESLRMDNSSILIDFANQCINSVRSNQKHEREFGLGIPLKCYILAVVNEKHAQLLTTSNRRKQMEIGESVILKSVCEMYEHFIETCMEKTAKLHMIKLTTELKQGVHQFHTEKAISLLFPEIQDVLDGRNIHVVPTVEIENLSIMATPSQNEFVFPHRTFAEYFAGKFFAEFWISTSKHEPAVAEALGIYFLQSVLGTPSRWSRENYDCIAFNASSSCPTSPKLETSMFARVNVVRFMNSISGKITENSNPTESIGYFKQILHNRTPQRWHRNLECDHFLRAKLYVTLLACLQEQLFSVLALLIKLARAFFDENDIIDLIHSQNGSLDLSHYPCDIQAGDFSVALLLHKAVSSGSVEAVSDLFGLFSEHTENWLLKFCQKFPLDLYTPLETAIASNDIDMFVYFIDKVNIPWERLIISCLLWKPMNEADINTRASITEILISRNKATTIKLTSKDIMKHLRQMTTNKLHNLHLILSLAINQNLSLKFLPSDNKQYLIENSLINDSDEQLIKLLLTIFRKCGDDDLASKVNWTSDFKSRDVLDILDVTDAHKTFSNLHFVPSDEVFKNLKCPETIRLLATIFPTFGVCNQHGWNYLHYAIVYENRDWVVNLLHMRLDVNERDSKGNTPLLLINMKQPLDLTKLLLVNNADAHAVNKDNQSYLHKLLKNCDINQLNYVQECIELILDYGSHELWNMKDNNGNTPFKILSSQYSASDKHLILTTDYQQLLFLFNEQFPVDFKKYECSKALSYANLIHMVFTCKISLERLKNFNKKQMLYTIMNFSNFEQLCVILLLLFPKPNANVQMSVVESEDCQSLSQKKSTEILSMLNVPLLNQTLGLICFTESFMTNLNAVRSLKVLLGICPDITRNSYRNRNYLHYCVHQGKVDWVKYLIESGHDVNQTDEYGCSPLLCVTLTRPLELIRLLVQHNADIYGLSRSTDMVRFQLVCLCIKKHEDIPLEWINSAVEKIALRRGIKEYCEPFVLTTEFPLNELSDLMCPGFSIIRSIRKMTTKKKHTADSCVIV